MVQRAIDSVWAQDVRSVDIIVVPNRPKHVARNVGIDNAHTPWVAFLDDDDEMFPNHLSTLLAAPPADLVYSTAVVRDATGADRRTFGFPFDAAQLRVQNIIPTGYMVRTDVARAAQFPEFTYAVPEDWGFLLRLLDSGATFTWADPPAPTWAINVHGANTYTTETVFTP